MYLYRVVPNSVISENHYQSDCSPINRTEFLGGEDIYYNMGYTSFIDEVGIEGKNYNLITALSSIKNKRQTKGKFFFLYLDEALDNCQAVINSFGNIVGDTYCLLVYDFPIDIILKNIGYGYYEDRRRVRSIESYIEISDFGSDIINSNQISDIEKLKVLRKLLSDSLMKEINDYNFYSSNSVYTIIRYFNEFKGFDLEKLKDDEWLNSKIKNCKLYDNILNHNGTIIKNNYLVGKNIPINIGWYYHNISGDIDGNIDFCNNILKQNGINDFIDKDNCYKNRDYIINHMWSHPDDKEGIKKLLKCTKTIN